VLAASAQMVSASSAKDDSGNGGDIEVVTAAARSALDVVAGDETITLHYLAEVETSVSASAVVAGSLFGEDVADGAEGDAPRSPVFQPDDFIDDDDEYGRCPHRAVEVKNCIIRAIM